MWDVSPQGQFTVTKETEALLKSVRARELKLEIYTFYEPLPQRPNTVTEAHEINIKKRLHQMTNDLLSRYQMLGGDSVEVTHIDILRDIEKSRKLAREYQGKQAINTVMVKLGERHKILSLGFDMATIDFPGGRQPGAPGAGQKPPLLKTYKGEEAVSSAIRSLIVEGSPVVYFLTGFGGPELGAAKANSYSEMLAALNEEGFEVKFMTRKRFSQGLPKDATMIALLEPDKEFGEDETQKIYEYLKGGGRFFLNLAYTPEPIDWNPTFEELGKLLGFRIGSDLVCHPPMDPNRPGEFDRTATDPRVVKALQVQFRIQHPITQPLSQIQSNPIITRARPIERTEGPAGVRVSEGLLMTGTYGWIAPRKRVAGVVEPDLSFPGPEARKPRSVGATIDIDAPDEKLGHMVIVSGLAFLNRRFKERNGDLALNIFNHLASRSELVTIRGNRYRSKKLELVPQQLARVKLLLTGWVPLSLLIMAFVVYFFRRRI